MNLKTTEEIFSMGYAVPSFNIDEDSVAWRFRDEVIKLHRGAVSLATVEGVPFFLGDIEDVRKAAQLEDASL